MSTQKSDITVSEIMLGLANFPIVYQDTIFKVALEKMNEFHLGIVCVVSKEQSLLGIITDGDIRRKLLAIQKPFSAFFIDDAIDHAVRSPVTVLSNESIIKAVDIMKSRQIWDLPVLDGEERLVGLLHLHPVIERLLEHTG